jgi:saccharopine dehydrogenase-like NADP-dependent oxidoreductase
MEAAMQRAADEAALEARSREAVLRERLKDAEATVLPHLGISPGATLMMRRARHLLATAPQ